LNNFVIIDSVKLLFDYLKSFSKRFETSLFNCCKCQDYSNRNLLSLSLSLS